MSIHLVSFATPSYYPSLRRLERSAANFGVKFFHSYNFEIIKRNPFYTKYRHILAQPRGAGYWLWKPFIILETLKQLSDEDVLIYLDCDVIVVKNLSALCELCNADNPILLVTDHGHQNKTLTRRDCFYYLDCDNEKYYEAEQVWAGLQVYRKTQKSIKFVQEYLDLCCDERILGDGPNHCGLPNIDGFIDHRYDQSVLSLLAEKAGLQRFRNPSQWGNHQKLKEFRVQGEWLPSPYTNTSFINSPYDTLLDARSPLVIPLRSKVHDILYKFFHAVISGIRNMIRGFLLNLVRLY